MRVLCFVHGTSCLTPPHRAIHRGRARRPPPTPKHRHIPTQGTCVKTRQLPKPHRTTTFCTKFGNFFFHTLCSKLSTCTGDVVFQDVPFANSLAKYYSSICPSYAENSRSVVFLVSTTCRNTRNARGRGSLGIHRTQQSIGESRQTQGHEPPRTLNLAPVLRAKAMRRPEL